MKTNNQRVSKSITAVIALVLMLAFSQAAFADDETAVETGNCSFEVTTDVDLADPDELLEGYLLQKAQESIQQNDPQKKMQLESSGTSGMSKANAHIYNGLRKKIAAIAGGDRAGTVIVIPIAKYLTKKTYTAKELGLPDLDDPDVFIPALAVKMFEDAQIDTSIVINSLLANEPFLLYWYDKTEGAGCDVGLREITKAKVKGVDTLILDDIEMDFSFAVSADYSKSGKLNTYVTNTKKTGAASKTAERAADLVERCEAGSDGEKVLAYKTYICEEVSYDEDAMVHKHYGDPWQIIYVFDEDPSTEVVCEGYSKAFKYLCDLSEFSDDSVECRLMSGHMAGGTGEGEHMWNVIHMSDGKNYMADITNSDEGTIGEDGGLFMNGNAAGKQKDTETYDYPSEKYVFNLAGYAVSYTYDKETLDLFDEGERTLARGDYKEGTTSLAGAEFTITEDVFMYDGSRQAPGLKVTYGNEVLLEGTDYSVSYQDADKKTVKPVNAGTYYLTVKGINRYSGVVRIRFTILKAEGTMTVKAKTATVKASALKNKTQTLAVSKVLTVKNKKGKATYVKKGGSKNITISRSSGKVTVKKGLKKGTYKVKVKVTDPGNGNYKKTAKTVTFTIKVK